MPLIIINFLIFVRVKIIPFDVLTHLDVFLTND